MVISMSEEKTGPEVFGFKYEEMLNRAIERLPEKIKVAAEWALPPLEVMNEGGRTIILNWKEIVTALNRDEKIVLRFLEHRLGTVGWIQKGRAILQGIIKRSRIHKLMDFFVKEYVICDVCGRPHTVLTKEKGQWIKKCEACGAWRVVERI